MTTYRQGQGYRIRSVASDPDNPKEGQVWYNRTSLQLKGRYSFSDSWSAGGNMNTGRRVGGGAGTQTAALYFAGQYDPTARAITEEYNGSSWTESGDLNQARVYLGATGSQTAGLAAGGRNTGPPGPESSNVEEYNGSSWTNVTALPKAMRNNRMCGPQTAALGAGGYHGYYPGSPLADTLEYDGTNWTTGGDLNNAGQYGGIAGTQTAAVCAGLYPTNGQTEEYNGSTWSNANPMGSGRYFIGTFGTQTSAVFAGGGAGSKANCERYDGTNWSTTTDLTVARRLLEGGILAPSEAGIVMAGVPNRTDTEEFTGAFSASEPFDVS
jgi:hypothetical protein